MHYTLCHIVWGVGYQCEYNIENAHCDIVNDECIPPTTTTTTTTTTIITTTTLHITPTENCTGTRGEHCYEYDNDKTACEAHYIVWGEFGFQCYYTEETGYCDYTSNTCEYHGLPTTTTSTTTTTRITTTTRKPTTTSQWITPTTLNSTSNYHPNIPSTGNCTNMTGQLMLGDFVHPALCALSIPIGPSWTMGFFVIFIMVITYTVTKRYEAVGIAGLLMIVLFLDLVPEIIPYTCRSSNGRNNSRIYIEIHTRR